MKQITSEKENEANRPPWRAVSLSTLPKPDKNALLRARLLDASRRLRAGRTSVAVQTDTVPIKVMKEVNLEAQTDLIYRKEVGILTDGLYTKKRYGIHEYSLTYSISQMTDKVSTANVSTQTLLPKIHNNLKNIMIPYRKNTTDFVNNRKNIVPKLQQSHLIDCKSNIHLTNTKRLSTEPEAINISHSKFITRPTLASWQFDYDAMENNFKQIFIPYTIQSREQYSKFSPLSFNVNSKKVLDSHIVEYFDLMKSIDNIIQESNNLMNSLDKLLEEKVKIRNDINYIFNTLPKFGVSHYSQPSEHWFRIIIQQEEELNTMLKQFSKDVKK